MMQSMDLVQFSEQPTLYHAVWHKNYITTEKGYVTFSSEILWLAARLRITNLCYNCDFLLSVFCTTLQREINWYVWMAMEASHMEWGSPPHWPVWWTFITTLSIHKTAPLKLKAVSIIRITFVSALNFVEFYKQSEVLLGVGVGAQISTGRSRNFAHKLAFYITFKKDNGPIETGLCTAHVVTFRWLHSIRCGYVLERHASSWGWRSRAAAIYHHWLWN